MLRRAGTSCIETCSLRLIFVEVVPDLQARIRFFEKMMELGRAQYIEATGKTFFSVTLKYPV